MIANYNTHTRWCNNAKGEAEDYIKGEKEYNEYLEKQSK